MIRHFQSISTEYRGATDSLPSRIIARTSGGARKTVNWNHAIGTDENHMAAARTIAEIIGWNGTFVMGATPTGAVFVLAESNGQEAEGFTLINSVPA